MEKGMKLKDSTCQKVLLKESRKKCRPPWLVKGKIFRFLMA